MAEGYMKHVPCIHCGNLVEKTNTDKVVNYGRGTLTISDVPEYRCECGILFAPHDVEQKIEDIINTVKKRKLKGNITVNFASYVENGNRVLPRR